MLKLNSVATLFKQLLNANLAMGRASPVMDNNGSNLVPKRITKGTHGMTE